MIRQRRGFRFPNAPIGRTPQKVGHVLRPWSLLWLGKRSGAVMDTQKEQSLRQQVLKSRQDLKSGQDKEALGQLWADVVPGLLNFLRMRCANEADACDILQETFVKFCQNTDLLAPPHNWRGWLFRVADNCFKDLAKWQKSRAPLPLSDNLTPFGPPDVDSDPAQIAECHEQIERVRVALANLRPIHRETLWMLYFTKKTRSEIAADLGISLETYTHRVSRAHAAFAQHYGDYDA
jgi:RNA polymerase sigma factor (sigma-70 family)